VNRAPTEATTDSKRFALVWGGGEGRNKMLNQPTPSFDPHGKRGLLLFSLLNDD